MEHSSRHHHSHSSHRSRIKVNKTIADAETAAVKKVSDHFSLRRHHTTLSNELVSGVSTFLASAYILLLIPSLFASEKILSYEAAFFATVLASIVGSLLLGVFANMPLTMLPGLSLNSFFIYTLCIKHGFTYSNALMLVLLGSFLACLLAVTGLSKRISDTVPTRIKEAVPIGIGLLLAFWGLRMSGLLIFNNEIGLSFASIGIFSSDFLARLLPIAIMLITILIICILEKKNVKGAVLIGALVSLLLYYPIGFKIPHFYRETMVTSFTNPFSAFFVFLSDSCGKVFLSGWDFAPFLKTHSLAKFMLIAGSSVLSFCFISIYDSFGVTLSVAQKSHLVAQSSSGKQKIHNYKQILGLTSLASCIGAVFGAPPIVTAPSSCVSPACKGRTGISSIVTALLFGAALLFSPLIHLIPSCTYSAILIYTGCTMMASAKKIDWTNPSFALPAFAAIIIIAFTGNIALGILLGTVANMIVNFFIGEDMPSFYQIALLVILIIILAFAY